VQWPDNRSYRATILATLRTSNDRNKLSGYSEDVRELEYAMSKPTSSSLPRHRIGILVFPEGRFLECADCQISFKFPDGAQFGAIAKQFEFHLCGPPIHSLAWRTERRFVVVRHEGKVPAMASCAKCQLKFFTPPTIFACGPLGAERYLLDKFDLHECGELPTK
jgi:hypothetical protein